MYQSLGFRDATYPNHGCRLRKSLYGLRQAPRAWYKRFADYASSIGFCQSKCEHSLFIYKQDSNLAYLLLYIDDIILTTSSDTLRQSVISLLNSEFAMKDLGQLKYFMGIAVTRHKHDLLLSQKKYVKAILSRVSMSSWKTCPTPVDTKYKMSATHNVPYEDASLYRSLTGALHYLTFARPDISYVIQQICLFMHNLMYTHMHALRRILRYIQGTKHYGLPVTSQYFIHVSSKIMFSNCHLVFNNLLLCVKNLRKS